MKNWMQKKRIMKPIKINIEKSKESINRLLGSSNYVRWSILVGVAVIFTVILYPGLVITEHSYKTGDVADRDIKSPRDCFIEDESATEANRNLAVEKILTVYDHDELLSSRLTTRVQQAFSDLRAVFEDEIQNQSEGAAKNKVSVHGRIWKMKESFEKTIGISVSKGAYQILEKEGFSKDIAYLISKILTQLLENGVVTNKEILLKEADKGIFIRDVGTETNILVNNLKQYYGLDQAKTMVRIIGQPLLKDLDYTLINLIVDFAQRLIQPNITLNRSATEELKKSAAAEIKPVLYKIKAGEMLLREGERVTEVQLLKLKTLQTHIKNKQILASSIGASTLLLCLLIITYIIHINPQSRNALNNNKNLLFIASMLITFIFIASISSSLSEILTKNTTFLISSSSILYGVPLAAGAMTVCLFMGFNIAISFAMLTALCTAIIFQNRFELFIYFLLNGTMAAYWIRNCRERKVFIKAGAKLGLLNLILVTAINIYITEFSGSNLLYGWAFAFIAGGVGSGVVAAGIAPLVEIAFDYTTDIKLLELANLDRPILRKLMIEAPGTYHHSVIVGSMVEAAASSIGANSLLAKVCGYYHDIGKIKKPLYFIENQKNGKNKHDKLAPSMSSLILMSHIKEGVEIAKENKLGQAIIDTIRQHHGTSLISYFYDKAKKIKGADAVNIDNFLYPGPKPQTREAALVMLADVVEAASRVLDNPTQPRIQGLVQDLINKIFSDGQLENCELTLKDLHSIAKSFNKILNGMYHHRIEYPEQLATNNGKGGNGDPDRQQAKQAQDITRENTANSTGHIKRLGLS
ncbi:MAG: HDIG domain-containing protein [Desulfobacteraceae bacterium]|nr:HDIG domain-containing protein [Pseudomonadota bacterium]MCG2755155.1 HDIG domain-containing protein [Desulfobacteraceae bacterium]